MGIGEVDWVQSLASGVFLALLAIGALFVAWIVGTRRPRSACTVTPAAWSVPGVWSAPLDVVLLQWHWAFYRAGVAGWLLMHPDRLPFADAPNPCPDSGGSDRESVLLGGVGWGWG